MRQSTRLIVNSVSTFGRMAFTVVVGLLVTRLLLQHLGKVDFGLLLALGATGTMLQFVTGALTTGVQRQLALEIARGTADSLGQLFSTAWLVYLAFGAIFYLIGVALTPVMMNVLTIPAERADAAWWVYQISLLTLLLAVTATPYRALLVAHQLLTVNAVADAASSVTRLAAVLSLAFLPWDWMVSFAALQLAGDAIVRWAVNGYCLVRFKESRPNPRRFQRDQLKEIASISVWTMLNQLSQRFRNQGGMLLLNIFFGPVVNAGYGIAIQVGNYALQLAHALRLTVMPAIVGAHAKGNQQSVHRLALVAGKYTVVLASLIFVPMWLEAERVLSLWLGEVPAYSVVFVRLIIVWTMIYVFGTGYQLALFATGNIGWRTRQNLLVATLGLLAAGIGFYLGLPPWFLPVTTIAGMIWLTLINVFGIGAEIELSPKKWLSESLFPTLAVLVPASIAAATVHWSMHDDNWRIIAVAATYTLFAIPLIWWVGLAAWERNHFFSFAMSALSRMQRPN
jgi:O-antigen/teichoic acid export membrane protein